MKHQNLTFLLVLLMCMISTSLSAHDIAVTNSDGVTIYYNYYWPTDNQTELSVSYRGNYYDSYSNEYTGNVVIPKSVTLNGNSYPVTRIGKDAFSGCSSLTSVTIPNSVTSIDYSAFSGCSGLTSVTIPNSVTSIRSSVFRGCSGLTSVTIPNSVTIIGGGAFYQCSGLTSVTIPNSVTSIGGEAFSGCSGLTSVAIPNSVTSIGGSAFYGTGIYNNAPDGVFYLDKWVCGYKGEKPSGVLKIAEGTRGIAGSAFYECSGLTSVTIPNSVTSIGESAFRGCSGLTSVTIPNSVTSIGESAFYGCSGLQSVVVGNGVTSLPDYVFCTGNRLKSLTIGTGMLSIRGDAFRDNDGNYRPIKTIWLTNTPPSGYGNAAGTVNYVANDQYTSLNNKTVYPFLSSIFEVGGVKYVPVSPSERTCDAIDCLYDDKAENVVIGETVSFKGIEMSVKRVHQYACYQNQYIKSADISLQGNVEAYAFLGCINISQATVNNGGYIGAYAFQSCTAMTKATLGKSVTGIGNYAFDGCSSLKSIVIPDATTSLGLFVFQNCSAMTSAKIGKGVKTVSKYAFAGCSLLAEMQIGSSVETIGEDAFANCKVLPSIVIPKSVTFIDNYVFYGCKSLKTVIMDEQESELALGSNGSNPLFVDCPLDSVYIGRNIAYSSSSNYGYSPFYRNTSLRSVTITDKETEISANEFYGCTNLKNVKIGDGVTKIGNWAFSGCSSLDYFAFGTSVAEIGQEAFSDCIAMTRLISRAKTPPTCGNQALDDISKWECTLSVPKGQTSAYQKADQWKEFFFIKDDAPGLATDISGLATDGTTIEEVFNLNGNHQKALQRGVNIVRMSDGTTRKVMVK